MVSHSLAGRLVFKRFESMAQVEHLPKHDDESAKTWLYVKLFVALLVEKLIRYATAVSPGDTAWRQYRPHSPRRNFKSMLNQLARVIEPHLSLDPVIAEWNPISRSLAEPPRRRMLQIAKHFAEVIQSS